MGKSKFKRNQQPQENVGIGTGIAGGLALGAGGGLMSAGGTTVTTCPPEDTSFYCKFVKGFNIFKMILFILLIVAIIGFLIWIFTKKK